jgi:membrane protein
MGQMRQGMAITMVCFSLYFFPNKKKMLICYIIASMFHISALVTLFFIFVPTKIPKIRTIAILLLTLISCSQLLYNNIGLIVSLLPSFGSAKIVYYATVYQPEATLSYSLVVYKIIVYCLLRYSITQKHSNPNIGYINFITNLYSYSIPLIIFLSFEPTLAGRVDYYFMALEPIIISYIIFNATKNKKLIYILFFSSIYLYQYINTLNTFKSDFIPYKNIFL